MPDDVRIFVGCAANHEDLESQAVLEWTLRKFTSALLTITWMQQTHDQDSWFYTGGSGGWNTRTWATPFSGFRWGLPYYARAEGYDRAIYMDSDFIVNGDIAELWNTKFEPGKVVIARGGNRFCCSMWHESAIEYLPSFADLKRDAASHHKLTSLFAARPGLVQTFAKDQQWNWMDFTSVPLDYTSLARHGVKAIHYTRMDQQVQLRHAIPRLAAAGKKHWFRGIVRPNDWPGLQDLFDRLLVEATNNGFPISRYMGSPPFGPYAGLAMAR